MIGKIVIGKSFQGCIKYCLEDKIQRQNEPVMQNRAEVLMYNKYFGNLQELVQQFQDVRQLNLKLSKPVLHITLSLAPGELLGKDKLMEMCEQCAKEMGFSNNQYIAVMHHNTNHQHLHLVANRIGFDGKAISDSNNYRKIANYCRKMEEQYGLKQVLNPRKFLSKEQRNIPRFDQRKEQLRTHIGQALSKSSNYDEFEQQMKQRGYEITKGRGISFTDEKKVKFKGSQVNYSLRTIEQILQKNGLQQSRLHSNNYAGKHQFNEENLKEKNFPQTDFKQGIPNLIEQVIKPENIQEQQPLQFNQKRKRKKKQSRHL